MSIFRMIFFLYYNILSFEEISKYFYDLLHSFILGFRLDLSVIAYLQVIVNILLIFYLFYKSRYIKNFIKYFLFISYSIIILLLLSDFGFYSYFKEHINILFFGLFDDDTVALINTFWQNYHVVWIISLFILFLYFLYKLIDKIFSYNFKEIDVKYKSLFFIFLFLITFIFARGSLGMYPLAKMIPDVSDNDFVNKLSKNGVIAFAKAYKTRQKSLKSKYSIIKETGFDKNITEAFEIFLKKDLSKISKKDLLKTLYHKTSKKDIDDYNVVVIMVESFGLPILNYQSDKFDIMGSLKRHFKEDILFKNFISSANGTINNLESLLLGIPRFPGMMPLSQSKYCTKSFKFAPPFILKNNGYKNTFIYGGDLVWRDVGSFFKYQGFDKINGKKNIYKNIKNDDGKSEYFHPWGIYDEYLYQYIFKQLKDSKQKQFIFALTTNNHPPYTVPKHFKIPPLKISKDLKNVLTGDMELLKKRFQSYAYALHSLGDFITNIKNSKLAKNTIIVVTADDNTVKSNMIYKKNKLFLSKNIPFYIYLPEKLKNKIDIKSYNNFGSHKDIFPTIYNLIFSETKYISVGSDMLDNNITHIGVNSSKIAASSQRVVKINNLKKKQKYYEGNFYRAILAVSGYLFNTNNQ